MPHKKIHLTSSFDLFPHSFRIVLKNYEQLLFMYFIPFLISALSFLFLNIHKVSDIGNSINSSRQIAGLVLLFLWLVISVINFPVTMYYRVKATRNNAVISIEECYRMGLKFFAKIWVIQLIYLISVVLGLILLIVPGLLLFRRLALAPYYVIDNPDLSIKEILQKASVETRPFAYPIYGAYGIVIFFQLTITLALGAYGVGIIAYLITLFVIFIPVLRYQEVALAKPIKS